MVKEKQHTADKKMWHTLVKLNTLMGFITSATSGLWWLIFTTILNTYHHVIGIIKSFIKSVKNMHIQLWNHRAQVQEKRCNQKARKRIVCTLKSENSQTIKCCYVPKVFVRQTSLPSHLTDCSPLYHVIIQ